MELKYRVPSEARAACFNEEAPYVHVMYIIHISKIQLYKKVTQIAIHNHNFKTKLEKGRTEIKNNKRPKMPLGSACFNGEAPYVYVMYIIYI